jgi:hypothetical protein
MDIELLLAHFDDESPTLEEGLSFDALSGATRPRDVVGIEGYDHGGGDPNSLPDQRWGLVVPEGFAGDRLLEIVEPLRKARGEQQGSPPLVFRAPPGLGPEAVSAWVSEKYLDESIEQSDRPRYLTILGDADLISWDTQQRLAADLYVGRLCFPREEDYEAYIHKILASERAKPAPARALFHTVLDGSAATSIGHRGLMTPTIESSRAGRENGTFKAGEVVSVGDGGAASVDDFFAAATSSDPALMFSISHGAGAPRSGWANDEEQRRLQGAMSFGGGARITAEDVAKRTFLPGGAWFYFACFGAGTPSESAFHHWLAALRDLGLFGRNIDSVLKSLPGKGARPFVAALPQAALANPNGPLAVMGHVDLAWTFSFQDVGTTNKFRPARFQDIFRTIVEGGRIGAGYSELARTFNLANADLNAMYDADERVKVRGGAVADDNTRKTRKATLWMLRQDLTAYVLLGDPAAYLNVGKEHVYAKPKAEAKSVKPVEIRAAAVEAPAGAKVDAARVEAAVFATLGGEALDAFAKHFEMSREELDRWIETYRKGGRAAVGG